MKKTITLIIVVALVAIGFYLTFTTVTMGGGMMRDDMMTGNENRQQEMEQQNMTGEMQGRYMIEGMMGMGSMMNNSAIVVTPDGGLVVLMGNQLYKYNDKLNLVKQTEINFNWDNWRDIMMRHRNMMMEVLSGQSQ